ncbi:polyprenyl synthetase family protein [Fodinibius halophilus]|uniref:Polyprenyl synthetase family protein n=1 Tax=Fodinibius halophilus TaxID=1736908 RepID=A0A6M1SYY1_9BACT|nr:polyprenyl synthetase family protein [Fodinibius halophilus]NGP89088.1 polyprenyl synthetase family protein [Fodinibius halophilus]
MKNTKQQQKLSKLIDARLAKLKLPQEPSLLYDPVRYTLSLAGKRVRPYLTLVACGICGGEVEEALPAALSIELLHNFTLLHDDIMDGAEKRRGKPSVYKKWDANTAILSGDAMYAKAFKQLQAYGRDDNYSKEEYSLILDLFLDSAEKVCEGQGYDLMFETQEDVSIEQYLEMIEGKTAALISGALTMGAAVAGASSEQIHELKYTGKKVGIAFQIQDDLLDVIADPEKFGKKRGGDIVEGKKTYLSLLALQRSEGKQHQQLTDLLSAESNTKEEIANVISIFRSLNVIEDTKSAMEYHYQEAIDHLQIFGDSTYKSEITEFFNRLISREY